LFNNTSHKRHDGQTQYVDNATWKFLENNSEDRGMIANN